MSEVPANEQDDIIARFVEELRKPTADGGNKRRAGTKVPWYIDEGHPAAFWRHFLDGLQGGTVDADSGAHPWVHAAWRLLAMVCQQTGNYPNGR